MISSIVYEIKKILKVKTYIAGISCLIFIGLLYFVLECCFGYFDSGFSAKAYKEMASDVRQGKLSAEEDISDMVDAMLLEGTCPEEMYTQNTTSELRLYQVVGQELEQTAAYDSYLGGVLESSQRGSSGIFARDPYGKRNNEKINRDYSILQGRSLVFSGSYGIWKFMKSDGWDVLMLLIMLLVVYGIFVSDYEDGCIRLINTYRFSGACSYISKACAGMLITGVIHCVMYLFRFAVVYFSYGQVDLSQPVQSLYGAYTTSLPVSIGGACVLFVLLKLLVLLSLFLGIALAGILLRNLKSYFIVIFVIAGIFAGAYKMLDGNSYLSYFKWINPVSFLSVESVLFQYKNINIGGIPVSYSVLCIIISMLISAACIALGVYGYSKSDYGKRVRSPKIKSGCGTSVFTYEAKKMWVCQKALVICGLYLLLGIVTYKPVSDRLYTKDEISYKYYISEVEGPYTEEKMSVLQGEAKRLEDIEEKLADSAGQMDATVLDYYQNELAKAVSLQEVMNYGAYLSEKGGSFVYEKGYRMLLGKDEGRTQLLIYMVVGLALMALLTVTMLQFDKSVGMNKIIHISANRPKAQRAKQINILFAGVVVWLITFAPWIYNVLSVFGTQGIAAPAFSLRFFDRWPGFVSVGGVIGIFYGAILIYIWLSGYLANLICKYINDTITAAVLAFVISMIPIVVIY